jgi:hypothetical protein
MINCLLVLGNGGKQIIIGWFDWTMPRAYDKT